MPYTSAIRGVLAAIVLLGVAVTSEAGEKTIVLEDHLKTTWSKELVTYPFEPAKGQCHVESVTLSGPKGQVPCQMSDVTFWPGSETSVKPDKDQVELTTSRFGAKLLLGRRSFSPPAASDSVPGPIAAMQM